MATAKLRGLAAAASSPTRSASRPRAPAGLFAFVNGGGDIKRLHAGHASREGLQAALLAEQGVEGPPDVIEARDGFMQAFAFGRTDKARPIALPPQCRSASPTATSSPMPAAATSSRRSRRCSACSTTRTSRPSDIERVEVETYKIAAEHAHTGWDDFASAQLSFPYLIGLAARFRGIKFEHFDDKTRRDPAFAAFARKLTVTAPPEIDRLYPQLRPARVTVTTPRGKFTRQADEALGSRIVPLDDAGLKAKFHDLVGPVLGAARAKELAERLWTVEAIGDVAPLLDSLAKPA